MNILVTGCALLFSLTVLEASAVVTVVECVDAAGDTSFRDKCPPGTSKAGDKVLLGVSSKKAKSIKEVAAANPVVLYSVPSCDACDLVRHALTSRGAPFNEKNVQDDATGQNELKDKTGALTVPTVLIGSTVLNGYNRSALESALNRAGYPAPDTASAPISTAQPAQ